MSEVVCDNAATITGAPVIPLVICDYPLVIDLPYNKSVADRKIKSTHHLKLPPYVIRASIYAKLETYCEQTGCSISDVLKIAWSALIGQYANQHQLILLCLSDLTTLYYHDNHHSLNQALVASENHTLRLIDLSDEFVKPIGLTLAFQCTNGDSNDRFLYANHQPELLLTCSAEVSLQIQISAAADLFSDQLLHQLSAHYEHLLESMLDKMDVPLESLSCLPELERQHVLYDCHEHELITPATQTILDYFELKVAQTPDAIAVVFEKRQLTYLELNERANQLAWLVRHEYQLQTKQELKPDTLLIVCVERGLDMLIAILATLKAGAAYVPVDPSYPEDRIAFIVEDTTSPLILTQSHLVEKLESIGHQAKSIVVDETRLNQPTHNLAIPIKPEHLAYVIYTSGTTGKPKGVLQTHGNVTRLFRETEQLFQFNAQDVWTLFHSYTFDFSVWELWGALFYGGQLVIPNHEETRDVGLFYQLCQRHHVTVLNQTPAAFYQFLAVAKDCSKLDHLRYVIFGGDSLNIAQLQPWWTQYGDQQPQLINMYGITETTVHVTYKALTLNDIDKGSNIGKPIRDLKAYVLDKQFNPVPLGVVGELYVGGAGLARGYLNRPELTAERFINNPFATDADIQNAYTQLYKTGDLVRREFDGSLIYIGRNDFQVKLRGFRIELGEIENILSRFEGIKQAVVLLHERQTIQHLIAYYVAATPVNEQTLRAHLDQHLPDYMVPSRFIHLNALPLTINGKLDRKALPQPDFSLSSQDYIAPRNALEFNLCQIWQEVLRVEQISINHSFLALGGHSLQMMQLVQQISSQLKKRISPREIYQYQTIELQAQLIFAREEEYVEAEYFIHDSEQRYAPFPLTDIQRAYLLGRSNAFALGGIQSHIYIENEQETLDIPRFEVAVNQLITRHDMLRARVSEDGTQQIMQEVPYYPIEPRNEPREAVRAQLIHQLKQRDTYPHFAVWISVHDQKIVIHFYFDLLIVDGTGLEVIFRELSALYECPAQLAPPAKISYRDARLSLEQKSKTYEQAKSYWLARIDAMPEAPVLPTRLLVKDESPAFIRRKGGLSSAEWSSLKKHAAQMQITPAVMLLTIYGEALKLWSRSAHFMLNVMFFNRPRVHQDIDRVVGNFSSTLLLEMDLQGCDSIVNKAQRIQQQLMHDLEHSEFNGIKVLNELNRRKGGSSAASMPVVFACALNLNSSAELNYSQRFKWYGSGVSYNHLETPQVWLDHQVFEEEDGSFCFYWDTRDEYFPSGIIEAMFDVYQEALKHVAHDVTKPLSLLPQQDQVIIQQANATEVNLPSACLHTEVFKQAKRTPDSLALVTKHQSLTYREMAATALQLKTKLDYIELQPNDTVVILMEKGWEQVVAALGIQAAGAAYIPVDAALPEERVRQIVSLSACRAVIVQKKPEFTLDVPVLVLSDVALDFSSFELPHTRQKPSDLAYIIFTSGSTGIPKGVMITHQAAFNTIAAINQKYQVTATDRVFAISSFSFDLSVFDTFGLLLTGASLYIPTAEELRNPELWLAAMLEQQITIWNSAPALMQLVVDRAELEPPAPHSLRLVMMSGDWIPIQLPKRIQQQFNAEVYSLGGATEASIWSNDYPIKAVHPSWVSIPYGKALANQTMYILDEDLRHRPVWATGMIYIGGVGLAQGYLGDAEKTAASFIDHPETKQRLYRTGDLGRLLPDGNIEFLGRDDLQVKVQGYRIELEEIEAMIATIADVDQVLVRIIGAKNEAKRIIAFVSSKQVVDSAHVKQYLEQRLPYYMIPNQILHMDSFPLTSNGKVDVKALVAQLNQEQQQPLQGYVAPEGELEQQMAVIWQELLNVPQVGRLDNFFALGGTSFLAFHMIHQVKKELGRSLSIAALFQKGSISELLTPEKTKSSLIALQPEGTKKPIFLVHPSGGGVICYAHLMNHLGKDQPLYGFQSLGYMENNSTLLTSVEEMATHYVQQLLEIKPDGDFWLGGWSFGGSVAFEMARSLKQMGHRLNPLLLIDSPAPLMREEPNDETLFAWFKADYGVHYEQLDEMSKKILFRVFKNNILALVQYNPQPTAIDLLQFKAQEIELEQLKRHTFAEQEDWGWQNISSGSIRSYTFAADHNSIVQAPMVEDLASKIKEVIESS